VVSAAARTKRAHGHSAHWEPKTERTKIHPQHLGDDARNLVTLHRLTTGAIAPFMFGLVMLKQAPSAQ